MKNHWKGAEVPTIYRITHEQMRFLWWLQLVSLLPAIGIFVLPFTIFYYLGWSQFNKSIDQSFKQFLLGDYAAIWRPEAIEALTIIRNKDMFSNSIVKEANETIEQKYNEMANVLRESTDKEFDELLQSMDEETKKASYNIKK